MDLKSGYPFWPIRNGPLSTFPTLRRDHACDVAVVGGGITGAFVASNLAEHGHDVAIFEERLVGGGSTAASTALIQYELDAHLAELAGRFGERTALLVYRACAHTVERLQEAAYGLGDVGLVPADSLYFASRRSHVGTLRSECALRRRHGFHVKWLDSRQLLRRFGFHAPGALLTRPAAGVDPYLLAHRLLSMLHREGSAVFDHTRVEAIREEQRGVRIETAAGHFIRARHVVLATGFAAQRWLTQKLARNASSYALVTDPIDGDLLGPLAHTLLWESDRPYLYMRPAGDGRLMIGGEDDEVDIPSRRDRQVKRKARRLIRRVQSLFPHLPLTPAFSWAGTFAETHDALPWFGPHPETGPRVHFAMAYGGNGIVYSVLGATVLRAAIEGRRHPLSKIFSFSRADW